VAPASKVLPDSNHTNWVCPGDAVAVASQAAALILQHAAAAIQQHGEFRLVLAGGSTPQQVYQILAQAAEDWTRWQLYFGDERCLPADHIERNSHMATASWLNHVTIPAENIHPIPAELGAEVAAERYAAVIKNARPFDLVLLGIGEDGHTASLFPGQHHAETETVHAIHDAPKPPPDRVSLSRACLSDSHNVLVLVSGASKRAAVQRWQSGEDLPIAGITAHRRLIVLLDTAAASI
jgi:6-phosphogluconolactonase